MKVWFRNNWFSPAGIRFRKSQGKQDLRNVPDAFEDQLPKSAVIVEKAETVEVEDLGAENDAALSQLTGVGVSFADAMKNDNVAPEGAPTPAADEPQLFVEPYDEDSSPEGPDISEEEAAANREPEDWEEDAKAEDAPQPVKKTLKKK